jgi:malonyl CoA-acyl carrier protein transacylase
MSGAHTSAVASATTEIALLFCGQGAQTVGMTQGEVNIPEVSRMYDVAKEVLGYDLKQIVLQGT